MRSTVIAVLAALAVDGAAVADPPTFEVVVLQSLGGQLTQAADVNESCVVVGRSWNQEDLWHAVVWIDGRIDDLGTLGGPESLAFAANNANQIVGLAEDSKGDDHAVLWTFDGEEWTIADLGMFDGLETQARGISDTGLIAGYANVSLDNAAMVWEDGVATALPELVEGSLSSRAFGVNAHNQVAGYSIADDGLGHLVMWEKHRGVWQVIDLGNIESSSTLGGWINDHGDVAGDWLGDTNRGFFHSDGAFTDLGDAPDANSLFTSAINNSGWIVAGVSGYGGFVWINGDLHMLADLVAPPQRDQVNASGVNEAGVIVGSRGCCGGSQDAIVLIPMNTGDLDADGDVDAADLILLLGAWGACGDCADCPADLDGDCDVDGADLIILLGNWG